MFSTLARRAAVLVVLFAAAAAVMAPAASAASDRKVVRVTVVDNTAGTWPGVREVVNGWRRSPYVDAKVAAVCRPHTYCVTLEAAAYGATEWHGQTVPTGATSALVQLNTSVPADAALQSAVLCHELGHTLGVAHPDADDPTGRWGCIAGTEGGGTTPTPSRADLAQLRAIRTGTGMQGVAQGWGALWAFGVSR